MISRSISHALVTLTVTGAILSNATANTIPDGSPVAPAGAPRSKFVNEPADDGFGKDPFFPKTTRFTKKPQVEVPGPGTPPPKPDFDPGLVLKGVSIVGGRKLAIINYQTVAEHEPFSIRIDGRVVKGECLEIKENSAVFKVNDVTKELTLGNGGQ